MGITSTKIPTQPAYFKCVDREDGIKVVRDTQKEALWREKYGRVEYVKPPQNDTFEEVIIE